jgi:glycerol-3-phosphate O-acyltransferase
VELDFEAIYKAYPRKEGKTAGMRALVVRVKDKETYDRVMLAAKNYALLCQLRATEPLFIKLFSTFVNNWMDYESIDGLVAQQSAPKETSKTSNNRLLMEGLGED